MKTISTLCIAAVFAASTAQAGGMSEPIVMAPVEVMEEAESNSSSGNLLIPLIILALVFAASQNGDNIDQLSDIRVKTDIVPVGTAENGLTIYQYRYTGFSPVFEGVMAQDVLMHTPEAVVQYPSGIYAVDYGMLGMELKIVQ